MRLTSLAPVVALDCCVLILGSMPGELSLDYATRLARLQAASVGVWDVLRHCVRSGSLDTSIVRGSEVPNDFGSLLGALPSLNTIALNGAKAAQTFRRTVLPGLAVDDAQGLTLLDMPSTSPANASRSLSDLVQAWSRIAC